MHQRGCFCQPCFKIMTKTQLMLLIKLRSLRQFVQLLLLLVCMGYEQVVPVASDDITVSMEHIPRGSRISTQKNNRRISIEMPRDGPRLSQEALRTLGSGSALIRISHLFRGSR
eukprot:m.248876 g.248876  ORF g.248876 m.248876 type:complete len:114 (-) comp16138_c0_seq1:1983-2324(-)